MWKKIKQSWSREFLGNPVLRTACCQLLEGLGSIPGSGTKQALCCGKTKQNTKKTGKNYS